MLWTISLILIVLWMLGALSAHTMGGFIHLLLLLAIVAVAIRTDQWASSRLSSLRNMAGRWDPPGAPRSSELSRVICLCLRS